MGTYLYICQKKDKLRIISKKILREFWEKHSDSQQQLKSWFQETSAVEWKNPKDKPFYLKKKVIHHFIPLIWGNNE